LAIGTVLGINFISPKPAQAQEQDSQQLQVKMVETSPSRPELGKPTLGSKIVDLVPKKTVGKHERNTKSALTVKLSSNDDASFKEAAEPVAGSVAETPVDSEAEDGVFSLQISAETDSASDSATNPVPELAISLTDNETSYDLQNNAKTFEPKDVPEPDQQQNNIGETPLQIQPQTATKAVSLDSKAPRPDNPVNVEIPIKPGDTLSELADEYDTSVDELVGMNLIDNPDLIIAGETLIVPAPVDTDSSQATGEEEASVEAEAPVEAEASVPSQAEITTVPETVSEDQNTEPDQAQTEPDAVVPAAETTTEIIDNSPAQSDDVAEAPDVEPSPEVIEPSISQLIETFISTPNIEIRDDLDLDELLEAMKNNGETWITKCDEDPGTMHVSSNPNLFKLMILAANSGYEIQVFDIGSSDAHSCSSLHGQGSGQLSAIDIAYNPELYKFLDDLIKSGNIYKIDELIYANPPDGTTTYDKGEPHNFSQPIVDGHRDHIHVGLQPTNADDSGGIEDEVKPPEVTVPEASTEAPEAEGTNEILSNNEQLREYVANINQDVNGVEAQRIQDVLNLVIDYAETHDLKLTQQGLAAYIAHGISESNLINRQIGDGGLALGWFQYHGNRQDGMGFSDEEQVAHSFEDMASDSKEVNGFHHMLTAVQDPNMSLEDVVTQGYKWLRPKAFNEGKATPAGGHRWSMAQNIYNDMQS